MFLDPRKEGFVTKHLPSPNDTDVWQAMCVYITFEALFLNLEQIPNSGRESPRVFSIPGTDNTTLTFYSERQFDPINGRLPASFHVLVQGIQSSMHLKSLHYFFYENGQSETLTENCKMIFRSFSTWNEGIASLFSIVSLSMFGHSDEIPQYLRNKGRYGEGA